MKQAKWFLLLHVILGIYAGSSVCSKLAAQQPFLSAAFIVLYGLMLLALVTYAVGWQQVIKHLPLTTAYATRPSPWCGHCCWVWPLLVRPLHAAPGHRCGYHYMRHCAFCTGRQ